MLLRFYLNPAKNNEQVLLVILGNGEEITTLDTVECP